LEDLANVAQPAYQHQPSATDFPAPFGATQITHVPNFCGGNSWMPPADNPSTEFMEWNRHNQSQSSSTDLIFVNETPPTAESSSSANSLIRIAPHHDEPSNTNADSQLVKDKPDSNVKTPIRFVYVSVPNCAKTRTLSGQAGPRRQHQSKEALALTRRNVRKKGAACGLCGEQRVKASRWFP